MALATCTIHLGDCLTVLAGLPDASVDAIVCDPPYGLTDAAPEKVAQCLVEWLAGRPFSPKGQGFMGKDWDAWVPGPEIWRECLRVLRPGGHLVAFAGTRMHDLMGLAIRLAGFEIRDELALQWGYATGFPKSLDVGRQIDIELCTLPGRHFDKNLSKDEKKRRPNDHLCPQHEAGDPWRGVGTALKPSYEPIVLARRPIVTTVARTALEHGTGGLDIDGCRLATYESLDGGAYSAGGRDGLPGDERSAASAGMFADGGGRLPGQYTQPSGRWPPNMLLVHHPDCERVGTRKIKTGTAVRKNGKGGRHFGGAKNSDDPEDDVTFADADGFEEIPRYRCVTGCPVRAIDEQSGTRRSGSSDGFVGELATSQSFGAKQSMIRAESVYGDEGGASRFFPTFLYHAKAAKAEREAGCENLPIHTAGETVDREDGSQGLESPRAGAGRKNGAANFHPTLKSIGLMRWLVRLVTPGPNAIVLDPFMGSGSTGIACIGEGCAFIGVEKDPDYYRIARARIEWANVVQIDEGEGEVPERPQAQGQQDLFR